jgi:hypothetical protein
MQKFELTDGKEVHGDVRVLLGYVSDLQGLMQRRLGKMPWSIAEKDEDVSLGSAPG